MKLPIYIISDNHFLLDKDKLEEERRTKLFKLFQKIKNTGGSLILGGDFFDFWIEFKFGYPSCYEDILNELEILHNNNIEIHYVLGNHDYWDFGLFKKKFGCHVHKKELKFSIDDKNVLVIHGDGLLKHDYLYRIMRAIIRNNVVMAMLRLIPVNLGCWLAKKISNTKNKFGKNKILNSKYKNELETLAQQRMQQENIDAFLMGHYHQLGIKNINRRQSKYIWVMANRNIYV